MRPGHEFSELYEDLAAARAGLLRAQIKAAEIGTGGQYQDRIEEALSMVESLLRDTK